MGVIGWLILGLAAGAIVQALHSGAEPRVWLSTQSIGILGALLGGLAASAVGLGEVGSFFSVGAWLTAMAGALLLLPIQGAALTRRGRSPARSEWP
jgi:uncharacterized membrane protein YeaQ/YmgE (transglycosylase-associated protein family)